MTLAADLQEPGGRLLLPAATLLTDRHLRYFQMWGVSGAEIEGDDAHAAGVEAESIDPAILADAGTAALTAHFRHADTRHPIVSQVLRHCVAREARRLASARVQSDA